MSRYELLKLAGLAGLVSGVLIMIGAVGQSFVQPVVSGTLFVIGHVLAFFLLTGVYAVHYSHTGLLGLLGYVLSTIGNSLFVTTQVMISFVVANIQERSVLDAVELASPIFPAAIPVSGALFALGLLLFAIANARVRALPAWPGWLMFAGITLNLILPPLLSAAPELVLVIPPLLMGFGIAGFGWALRSA